jgi:hypothetical protein
MRILKFILVLPFTVIALLLAALWFIPRVAITAAWETSAMSYADVRVKMRLLQAAKLSKE